MAIAKNVLEELGLSDKEAKVYLTLLELGASPVQKIGHKAGVNRATTYVCLEALLKLGLVSTVKRGVKSFYTPEDPEQLKSLVAKQQKELESKSDELNKVIEDLKKSYEYAGDRPVVRFYEGKEGIRIVDDNFLKGCKSKKAFSFIPLDDVLAFENEKQYQKKQTDERVRKKIQLKTIYTYSKGPHPTSKSSKEYREALMVPGDKFPISSEIIIYDDKISMVSYKNKVVGVIIENKDFAETLKSIFKLSWESAKKYDK